MATGIPIVVTKCGGPEEIVTPGRDSLMVPPADSRALSAAISKVIESSTDAEELARQATVAVKSRFSIDSMVDHYEKIYELK
jgi:glycosyltransferase involved in cell wall biosynthesis